MLPLTVPRAATAMRPAWDELPPDIRTVVETHCGTTVVAADSMGAGFTPGFASRLRWYAEATSDWLARRRGWR